MTQVRKWQEADLLRLAMITARQQGVGFTDAEDIASAVVTLYLESHEQVRFPAAWVKLVAKRKSWALNRSEATCQVRDEDALEGTEGELSFHDNPLERRLDLRAALSSLGREEREIVLLRDMAGEAFETIVGKTGLSLATVKRQLKGGRSTLRRALNGNSLRPLRLAGEFASDC